MTVTSIAAAAPAFVDGGMPLTVDTGAPSGLASTAMARLSPRWLSRSTTNVMRLLAAASAGAGTVVTETAGNMDVSEALPFMTGFVLVRLVCVCVWGGVCGVGVGGKRLSSSDWLGVCGGLVGLAIRNAGLNGRC